MSFFRQHWSCSLAETYQARYSGLLSGNSRKLSVIVDLCLVIYEPDQKRSLVDFCMAGVDRPQCSEATQTLGSHNFGGGNVCWWRHSDGADWERWWRQDVATEWRACYKRREGMNFAICNLAEIFPFLSVWETCTVQELCICLWLCCFLLQQPVIISDVNLFKRELGLFPLPKPFVPIATHKSKLW